jgi:hypothetical protein
MNLAVYTFGLLSAGKSIQDFKHLGIIGQTWYLISI